MKLNWIEEEFRLRTRASMFLENLDTGIGQFWDELKQCLRSDIVNINQHWIQRVGGGSFSVDDTEETKIQIWKHSWPGFEVTITLDRKAESLLVKWARIDADEDPRMKAPPKSAKYEFELTGNGVEARGEGGTFDAAEFTRMILLPLIRANETARISKLLNDPGWVNR